MKKLMNILMLSCKKSSELVEKKFSFGLTLIEKIQLSMHTSMCDACKSWEKQSKDLDVSLKNYVHSHSHQSNGNVDRLSDEIKDSIISKLEE